MASNFMVDWTVDYCYIHESSSSLMAIGFYASADIEHSCVSNAATYGFLHTGKHQNRCNIICWEWFLFLRSTWYLEPMSTYVATSQPIYQSRLGILSFWTYHVVVKVGDNFIDFPVFNVTSILYIAQFKGNKVCYLYSLLYQCEPCMGNNAPF